jgi:hypothetical protein
MQNSPMPIDHPTLQSRRQFLHVTPLVGLAVLVQVDRVAAQEALLKDSDAEAAAIEYRSDASRVDRSKYANYAVGQNCGNCNLFSADKDATTGSCGIVFGKVVSATGWCSSYEKKTG